MAQGPPGADRLQTIVDSEDLRIAFEPGAGSGAEDGLVLSFTGVHHGLGGLLREEFRNSLRRPGVLRDACFVIDRSRTWYNATGERIRETLTERFGGRPGYTLGNSMGAFGAILFGEILGCKASLAFSPQYSVDPKLAPFETRWREHISLIRDWRFRSCVDAGLKAPPVCHHYVFCGGAHLLDVAHARLIHRHARGPATVFMIRGGDHLVVRDLKANGAMHGVIDEVLSGGGREQIEAVLDERGIRHEVWPSAR